MLTSWVQILRREFQAEELEKLSAFVGVIEVRRLCQLRNFLSPLNRCRACQARRKFCEG